MSSKKTKKVTSAPSHNVVQGQEWIYSSPVQKLVVHNLTQETGLHQSSELEQAYELNHAQNDAVIDWLNTFAPSMLERYQKEQAKDPSGKGAHRYNKYQPVLKNLATMIKLDRRCDFLRNRGVGCIKNILSVLIENGAVPGYYLAPMQGLAKRTIRFNYRGKLVQAQHGKNVKAA